MRVNGFPRGSSIFDGSHVVLSCRFRIGFHPPLPPKEYYHLYCTRVLSVLFLCVSCSARNLREVRAAKNKWQQSKSSLADFPRYQRYGPVVLPSGADRHSTRVQHRAPVGELSSWLRLRDLPRDVPCRVAHLLIASADPSLGRSGTMSLKR